MAALAQTEQSREQPSGPTGGFVWKEIWRLVRKLTPAEGLALVCLTSWAQQETDETDETGLVQASDRQVCSETGVSREIMKRLRRKLGAVGIQITPGSNLSHDSFTYDLRKVLKIQLPEKANLDVKLGVKTTEAVSAKGVSDPSGGGPAPDPGALPQWELTSCGATVQVAYADIEFEVDLPLEWDDDLERQIDSLRPLSRAAPEQPVFRPLPPYEEWLARR